jgi:uncharacterized surface protein with fasciclin (FAS1) repeats
MRIKQGGKIIKKIGLFAVLLIAAMLFASGCSSTPEEVAQDTAEEAQDTAQEAEEEAQETAEEATGEIEEAQEATQEAIEAGQTAQEAEERMNIVQTAVDSGQFDILITAIQTAELEETLSGEGPFTVFAPTDAAFDALPPGYLDALLDDKDALTNVLLYHVAEGELMAADVVEMESIETMQGGELTVNVTDDTVMVNDATIVTTDIETSNGVIHVIDAVLIPPA